MTELVWSTACPDWADRLKEGRSLMPCGPIFPAEAEEGMKVFRSLKAVGVPNPDGGGEIPELGQICGEWAQDIAEAIFGAYDAETGERLIREVFLKVPKKNWKSGWAGLLMLALMVRNWRPSNEAAIIAPTKDGADNVFKPMRDAIKADPEMADLFHVEPVLRRVTHRTTGMSCKVYAADSETVAGKIWAFVILEELWQLAKRKGAEDMLVEATGGQASRPEGVVISITTESDEEPVGIHKAKQEFARKVRDGEIHAPHFLPILFEWPQDMLKSRAYMDPANFHLVNPNYGASVDPVDMNRKFVEAVEGGGDKLRVFLAKRLNVPPSENVGGSWPGAEFWAACGEAGMTLEVLLDRSEVAVIGLDGGGLDDLFGLVVMGREKKTKRWLIWAHAWAHRIVLKRRKDIYSKLIDLERAGDLTIVETPGEDVAEVVKIASQVAKAGLLPPEKAIAVDSAGLGAVVDGLTTPGTGVVFDQIVAIPQGGWLTGAIKTLERAAAGKSIVHGAQELMAWCVGNAKVTQGVNSVTISKAVAGSAKIDPLMAAFNATSVMMLNPAAQKKKLVLATLG